MCYYHSPSLVLLYFMFVFFFFQAEDGIRDSSVTGVQTCALPIYQHRLLRGDGGAGDALYREEGGAGDRQLLLLRAMGLALLLSARLQHRRQLPRRKEIGRASCRERV